jgi:hypothetical protein
MVRDVPPFGGYNDPDFARGVAWIMGFMDPAVGGVNYFYR